jgi:DNA-binding HxlR family transcriptional regulator
MSETREAKAARRTYDQYCALAIALDVVGERWTLLVVRELLIRPRRYAELLHALPGIGTNLLADRLRSLGEAGIVRAVDSDDPRSGYELTEHGEALRPAVLAMARWGMETMTSDVHRGHVNPSWAQLGVQALIDDERASEVDEDYVFYVGGEGFTLSVRSGHAEVHSGAVRDPAMTIVTDPETLMAIGSRSLDPIAALVAERLTVTGEPLAMPRCLRLLGLYGDPAVVPDGTVKDRPAAQDSNGNR